MKKVVFKIFVVMIFFYHCHPDLCTVQHKESYRWSSKSRKSVYSYG